MEAIGDEIGNEVADKITSVSERSSTDLHSKKPQNNESNDESETPKGRYIPP